MKQFAAIICAAMFFVCCETWKAADSGNKNKNCTAGFTEKSVEVENPLTGNILRGTLYLPEGSGTKPLIITLHELGGDALRPWWVNYSRHWAAHGYAVLGFDFAGGGKRSRSTGLTTEMSVMTEVSDLEYILAYALKWDFVDRDALIFAGGSQGGGVATVVAAKHKDEIAAMVLLYPAFSLPDSLHANYPDPDNWPETDTRNAMITIGRRYIEDMYDYNYEDDMRLYDKPVLIVHGGADRIAPLSYSEKAVTVFKYAVLKIIKGAGHVFLSDAHQQEFLHCADDFLQHIKARQNENR